NNANLIAYNEFTNVLDPIIIAEGSEDNVLEGNTFGRLAKDCADAACVNVETAAGYDVNLTADLTEGVLLGFHGVTLDCQGHSITGDGSGHGIMVDRYMNGVTIRNCAISGFGTGINLYYVQRGQLIEDNAISSVGTGIRFGDSVWHSTVTRNTITEVSGAAITMWWSNRNNVISANKIGPASRGIHIDGWGNNANLIAENELTNVGVPIFIAEGSTGNILRDNIICSDEDPCNAPPEARCRDAAAALDGEGRAVIDPSDVDGGSSDPDGDEIALELSQDSFGCADLGEHTVTLTATDPSGESSSCEAVITVADETPPLIGGVAAEPAVLWPPNHKMAPVMISFQATDNCEAEPVGRVAGVASNEPGDGLGDGDASPDWSIGGGLELDLRAERSGKGSGRVYTITIESTDASGNSSYAETAVTVPHDKKKSRD
ncbi:MAG: right-handed parallel beta-helix repeat-containing protein, partial [Elusimicrobiota bacterium]